MHAALCRPWRRITARASIALLLSAASMASPAQAQFDEEQHFGNWTLIPYEGLGPGSCLLMTRSPQKDASFIAFVGDDEQLQFGFMSASKDLSLDSRAAMDLRIDGQSVPLSAIRPFDESVVLFRQSQTAPRLEELLATAGQIHIMSRDYVSRFRPSRTPQAIAALLECYDLHLEALGDMEEDRHQAANTPTPPSNASGLDAAMDGMSGSGSMIAQFACEVSGPALTGIPDILNKNQMTEMMLSIAEDGSATINGTQLAAASVRRAGDGSLQMAAYDGRMVVSAVHGTPGSAAPVWGLSPQQLEAYQAFQGIGRQMTGMVMGNRARFMLVNLAQDAITFFDVEADDRPTNQQSPFCIRTQ
ncbi:hypothetical protein [Aureimonas frigidaquae]|uniref:Metallo-beta-lactamase superfamily protein n=1 Tax=Aureimonas frigidaquae TaxID=424757 RepID=A0A0P0Z079_9HYPH|nr:hypothetical protein [Aureimonas frigidaquae]BAT27376.1 metallo-beta-lactamase superfamily protein [Aureimonas frigidaquae]